MNIEWNINISKTAVGLSSVSNIWLQIKKKEIRTISRILLKISQRLLYKDTFSRIILHWPILRGLQ